MSDFVSSFSGSISLRLIQRGAGAVGGAGGATLGSAAGNRIPKIANVSNVSDENEIILERRMGFSKLEVASLLV